MVCYCLYQANAGRHQLQNCLKSAPIHRLVSIPSGGHKEVVPENVLKPVCNISDHVYDMSGDVHGELLSL